jgi:SNF2 family DNA or RNA helicase
VLRQRLGASFLRRRRAEVLSQLPPRTDTRIDVELTPEQLEEHAQFDRPIATLASKAQRRPLTQSEFLQLMQLLNNQRLVCNGLAQYHFDEEWPRCKATPSRTEHFMRSLYSPKLIAFRELVEQMVIGQQRKVAVFSQWRNMLRLAHWSVQDLLAKAGLRAAFFTGAESRKLREQALVDFHDDPAARVLFLSDAGGVGLNLQRAASCLVNLELPWNPAVLEQRIGRVYRLGQTDPVDVLHLVSDRGIESRIAELVARKQAVFATLFDGTSDEVLFDGKSSFLAGVQKLVDPELAGELGAEPTDSEEEFEQLVTEATERQVPSDEPPTDAEPVPITEASGVGAPALRTSVPGLSIERTASGALRIEAPPELAAPLAQLFETLAASLRAGTR